MPMPEPRSAIERLNRPGARCKRITATIPMDIGEVITDPDGSICIYAFGKPVARFQITIEHLAVK